MKKNKTEQVRTGDSETYSVLYRLLAGFFLWLYRVRIHHPERQPAKETYLLCSNHISAMDPVILACALPLQQPHFMSKKELFRIPLLGRLLRTLNAYPVDRTGGDIAAIKSTVTLINSGSSVGIFPQGTRCAGMTPREGADRVKGGVGLLVERTHAAVLPVCIKTKKNKLRLFCRTDVIVGEPMRYDEVFAGAAPEGESRSARYDRIATTIYDRICDLYEEE